MDQGLPCRECLGKFGPGQVCPVCAHLQRLKDYLFSARCPGVIAPQLVLRLCELHRSVLEDAEAYWASRPPPQAPREEHPTTAPKRLASPKASGGVGTKGAGKQREEVRRSVSPLASGGADAARGSATGSLEVKKEPSEESKEGGVESESKSEEKPKRKRHRHHRQHRKSPSPKKDKKRRKEPSSSASGEKSPVRERKSRGRSVSGHSGRRPRTPPGPPPVVSRDHRPGSLARGSDRRGSWQGVIPAAHRRSDLRDPREEIVRKKKPKANKGQKKREQQAAYKRRFQGSLWGRR